MDLKKVINFSFWFSKLETA